MMNASFMLGGIALIVGVVTLLDGIAYRRGLERQAERDRPM